MGTQRRSTTKDTGSPSSWRKGDLFRYRETLRLTSLNPATISYLLGAAGVGFRGFLTASFASVPGLLVEVCFGHAGKHAARLAGGGRSADHLHDLAMGGGLVVCIVVMVLVSKMARKALSRAVGESDAGRIQASDKMG